jgi:riboflavin kinase/FMN adenylyltransferase
MRVFYGTDNLPVFKNSVITLGAFDGVHKGHQMILDKMRSIASQVDGESIVITFRNHPRLLLDTQRVEILTSIDEKLSLLESYKIDNVVIIDFDTTFSKQSPGEYIANFLVKNFHPHTIVIGYDHRFGAGRKGDILLLKSHQKEYNYKVFEIEKQLQEDIAISSTKIRNAIQSHNIENANKLLGHTYLLKGTVVEGEKIGRTIGYPTANIKVSDAQKLIPAIGIYAATITVDEIEHEGMLYIGTRPVLEGIDNLTIEINIFDYNQNIYTKDVVLKIHAFIREDLPFTTLEQLKSQLGLDKIAVQNYFNQKSSCAIVILNFNGKKYLEQFLPTLIANNDNQEIIIADNASTDDSIEFLSTNFPSLKIIQLDVNHGFAGGYNEAIALLNHKYILLLNSDVEVSQNWLQPLITKMESDHTIAACQPKIRSFVNKGMFEYAGAAGGMMDVLGYPFSKGRIFDNIEQDNGQYNHIDSNIAWASGAAMLVRTDLFKKFGGFDADYFAHMEEIDLCWRWRNAGYKIAIVPESIVYHVGGGTLDYQNPKKTYLNFRNSLVTIFKNENTSKLLWLLPLRLILDGVAGAKFLMAGQWRLTIAILKAHFYCYGNILKIYNKRLNINTLINENKIGVANTEGVLNKSIIVEYYLKGRNKYTDLL